MCPALHHLAGVKVSSQRFVRDVGARRVKEPTATRPGRAHSTSLLTRSIIMRYSGRSYESLAVEGAQAAGSSRMLSISLSSSPCSANVEANDG